MFSAGCDVGAGVRARMGAGVGVGVGARLPGEEVPGEEVPGEEVPGVGAGVGAVSARVNLGITSSRWQASSTKATFAVKSANGTSKTATSALKYKRVALESTAFGRNSRCLNRVPWQFLHWNGFLAKEYALQWITIVRSL